MLAGVLFGLAGAIKPQALVLLPVALLATRRVARDAGDGADRRVRAALVSALLFGVHAWIDWLAAVSRFAAHG